MNVISLPNRVATANRSLGPDAIRAGGALLVVILHAAVPYLVHPMPGLVWPVQDQSSATCDAVFWATEVFVMPLFLILSGLFSYRAFASLDTKSFLRSRSKRLLRPLLFGIVVILPIDLYIWMLGLIAQGELSPAKLRSLKVPAPHGEHLWGLSHLWYLMYLFLFILTMMLLAKAIGHGVPLRLRPLIRKSAMWVLGFIGTAVLCVAPEVVYGFQHAFLPVPTKWIYCGTFFAGGVALAIFDPHFRTLDRTAAKQLAIGIMTTMAAVILGTWRLRMQGAGASSTESSLLPLFALSSITVTAAWTTSLGLIGIANRLSGRFMQTDRAAKWIHYLAGASFWVYLVHHPVVGLVQIDLKWLFPALPAVWKLAAVVAITVAWSLASYHVLIRGTRVGVWLGIADPAPRKSSTEPQSETVRPASRAAA